MSANAAIQRGGGIRVRSGKTNSKAVLHGFIRDNVAGHASRIVTDEWPAYQASQTPTLGMMS